MKDQIVELINISGDFLVKDADITITVIQSVESEDYIYSRLMDKFERLHHVPIDYIKEPKSRLIVHYKDKDHIDKIYNRDSQVFDSVLKWCIENEQNKFQLLKNEIKEQSAEDTPIFLTLQYETKYKDILRYHYNFIFEVSACFGMEYAYEEIETGFIIFHKKREDFELSLINLNDKEEIIAFFRNHGNLTKNMQDFINQTFDLIEQRKGEK